MVDFRRNNLYKEIAVNIVFEYNDIIYVKNDLSLAEKEFLIMRW